MYGKTTEERVCGIAAHPLLCGFPYSDTQNSAFMYNLQKLLLSVLYLTSEMREIPVYLSGRLGAFGRFGYVALWV